MLDFEVLVKEFIQLLLLDQGEGVDLNAHQRVWDKFYGVVLFLPVQELIECFLGEDVLELLVEFGYYVLESC